jgi:hypothetical protein
LMFWVLGFLLVPKIGVLGDPEPRIAFGFHLFDDGAGT